MPKDIPSPQAKRQALISCNRKSRTHATAPDRSSPHLPQHLGSHKSVQSVAYVSNTIQCAEHYCVNLHMWGRVTTHAHKGTAHRWKRRRQHDTICSSSGHLPTPGPTYHAATPVRVVLGPWARAPKHIRTRQHPAAPGFFMPMHADAAATSTYSQTVAIWHNRCRSVRNTS